MKTSFLPRMNYSARLEPEDRVLHGAGQSPEAFEAYVKALGRDLHPALYMHYCGLKRFSADRMKMLDLYAEAYPGLGLIPQIGLTFCYIIWNWASYPMWHDWGDCRIEENPEVLERYRREMENSLYLPLSLFADFLAREGL